MDVKYLQKIWLMVQDWRIKPKDQFKVQCILRHQLTVFESIWKPSGVLWLFDFVVCVVISLLWGGTVHHHQWNQPFWFQTYRFNAYLQMIFVRRYCKKETNVDVQNVLTIKRSKFYTGSLIYCRITTDNPCGCRTFYRHRCIHPSVGQCQNLVSGSPCTASKSHGKVMKLNNFFLPGPEKSQTVVKMTKIFEKKSNDVSNRLIFLWI